MFGSAVCISFSQGSVNFSSSPFRLLSPIVFLSNQTLRGQCIFKVYSCLECKGKGYPITCHWRHRWGVEIWLYSYLTSMLGGSSGQCHTSAALPPGKGLSTSFRGGCVASGTWCSTIWFRYFVLTFSEILYITNVSSGQSQSPIYQYLLQLNSVSQPYLV